MSKKTRDKSLSYHRAAFIGDDAKSLKLASCILHAFHTLKTAESRIVLRGNGQVMRLGRYKFDNDNGVLVHIIADTPGEKASVVPSKPDRDQALEVGIVAAPPSTEFMDGDAFLYVRGNDVCFCSTGMHLAAIRFYFQEIFTAAKLRAGSDMFDIVNIINMASIDLIHKIGVQELQLKGAMYSAGAEYSKRKNEPMGVLGAINKHMKAVLKKDNDITPDGLQIGLTIRTDARSKNLLLGRKRLNDITIDVLKDQKKGDEFIIRLVDGKTITPDDIYVSTSRELDALGKSVSRDSAWDALVEYFSALKADGMLNK